MTIDPTARRRRGVMLLEMLITIGVIAIFLVVAGKLFTTTLRLTHASQSAAKDIAIFESCVAALRRDVWGAAEMTAPAEGGVLIKRGDGASVTWSAEGDGALVRRGVDETSAEVARRWPGMAAKVSLHPDAAGLVVRAAGDDDELRLISQVLVARRTEAP
ncbi:MAG: hypothetical protein M3478_08645 [Planctomycetota bacterium]|nr:hypothetical protein [Planctomycetota bacterium]